MSYAILFVVCILKLFIKWFTCVLCVACFEKSVWFSQIFSESRTIFSVDILFLTMPHIIFSRYFSDLDYFPFPT
jgi:hypothetical protein